MLVVRYIVSESDEVYRQGGVVRFIGSVSGEVYCQ